MRIGVDEDFLDRAAIGPVGENDIGELAIKRDQAFGQRCGRIGANLTVGDMAEPIAQLGDDAPAGGAQARVEADDDQPSFSITASETS